MARPPRNKRTLPNLDGRHEAQLFEPQHLTEEEQGWWEAFVTDVIPLSGKPRIHTHAPSTIEIHETPPPSQMLDLHGCTQEDAFRQLINHLHHAHEAGWQQVTVITGQGRKGQGILKQAVPRWLEAMPPWVDGWEHTPPHQGGKGALQVTVKRKGRDV